MKRIKYESCYFVKSTIKGVFDKENQNQKFPFSFLKFSKPKSSYLIRNGVSEVVQSWGNQNGFKEKILHTGLIRVNTNQSNLMYGNNLNSRGKKDFILLEILNENTCVLYLVKNRNPRNKTKFSLSLINQILYYIMKNIKNQKQTFIGRKTGGKGKYTSKSREMLLEVFKDKFQRMSKDINFIPFDERFTKLKPYAKLLCAGSDDVSKETRKIIFNSLKDEFKSNRLKSYLNQLPAEKRAIEMRQYLQMLSPKEIQEIFSTLK